MVSRIERMSAGAADKIETLNKRLMYLVSSLKNLQINDELVDQVKLKEDASEV